MTEEQPLNPRPPAPPQDIPSASDSGMDFLHRRLQDMERDLLLERERTRQAEDRLKQQDVLRAEADKQLKEILDQLRQEKAERERDEEKSHARGRISALETRLDEMHQTWANLLRETISKKEAEAARPAPPMAEDVKEALARLTSGLEDRLGVLMRERQALNQVVEESRHQIRRELAKEQLSLQTQFNDKLEEVKKAINLLQTTYLNSFDQALPLKEQMEKLRQTIQEPASAKDMVIADLEQQKRDLMKAMKDRTDQLRNYTLERREVERSMGEAMMDLNRNLETQRARYQQLESSVADLRLQISALTGQLELSQKTLDEKDKRFSALAAERDELVRALMEEAKKVQQQISDRASSDKLWDERVARVQAAHAAEKELRLQAETQMSDLRAKAQTLTEHIARTLQEKDKSEGQAAAWKQEREELFATLQKKEEMISMLSATFQNMMRK